ncbi:ATP synthase d subunit, partial [Cichlidogyrus casuarinus]
MERLNDEKAPIQQLADKIAGYFVPFVCLCAGITLTVWVLVGWINPHWIPDYGESCNAWRMCWEHAFRMSITVLIIACPCSLGLATPTAVMVGTGAGARNGILIKGGQPLENMCKVTTILFDKTGTVTVGRPLVTRLLVFTPDDPLISLDSPQHKSSSKKEKLAYSLLQMAASAELSTQHPIADAITRLARTLALAREIDAGEETLSKVMFLPTKEVHTETGLGLQCRLQMLPQLMPVDARIARVPRTAFEAKLADSLHSDQLDLDYAERLVVEYVAIECQSASAYSWLDAHSVLQDEMPLIHVGSRAWMKQHAIEMPSVDLDRLLGPDERQGQTLVMVAVNKRLMAALSIHDPVKPDAALAICALREMGISVCLLTGDNPTTAAAIARQVGINEVYSQVLPAHKAAYVQRFQRLP